MNTSELEQEILRLKMQVGIIMALLFQTALYTPSEIPMAEFESNKQQLLRQLEEQAKVLELVFLNAPTDMSDARRALIADEIREAHEMMKSCLTLIQPGPKPKE